MVQHYATYVLHLQKALDGVNEALQLANPTLAQQARQIKDNNTLKEQKRLMKLIMVCRKDLARPPPLLKQWQSLEEDAAARGAPGLSICLSQPFQRLLKYPLLFQSLLFKYVYLPGKRLLSAHLFRTARIHPYVTMMQLKRSV